MTDPDRLLLENDTDWLLLQQRPEELDFGLESYTSLMEVTSIGMEFSASGAVFYPAGIAGSADFEFAISSPEATARGELSPLEEMAFLFTVPDSELIGSAAIKTDASMQFESSGAIAATGELPGSIVDTVFDISTDAVGIGVLDHDPLTTDFIANGVLSAIGQLSGSIGTVFGISAVPTTITYRSPVIGFNFSLPSTRPQAVAYLDAFTETVFDAHVDPVGIGQIRGTAAITIEANAVLTGQATISGSLPFRFRMGINEDSFVIFHSLFVEVPL